MPRAALRTTLGFAVALFAGGSVLAQPVPDTAGLAGSYLAARSAVIAGDHRAAATYFEQALAADPGNPVLLGSAMFSNAALGQWQRADEISQALADDAPGQELANLVRLVAMLERGELAEARQAIEAGRGAGSFIDGMALAWLHLADGNMSRAVETFEAVAAQDAGLADLAFAQLGFARAAVGDFETAARILAGEARGRITMTERVVEARAEILVQLGRRDEALELLDFYTSAVPDPSLLSVRDRLATVESQEPYTFLTTAEEGLAETFFSVARAFGAESGAGSLPLLYARAAHAVDPTHGDALLYAGQLTYEADQYELAADVLARVPADDDQYVEAQMARADALFDGGDETGAIDTLTALSAARPDLSTVHAARGDMLRRTDDCAAAIDAYSDALALADDDQERFWFVYYTRAICYERLDNWPPAEADFRKALELNPDQPNVLNYLGYSLVEQRRNLDEALDMIERAVAARPDSGFITDSLGWVFYRLGRFEEAVEPMERAVELEPNDPIINDHLGDVYWMVGRYREAEFQWHRALSFDPEPEDAARIRRKLEVGLTVVLEEEAATGESQ
jgi:tetratricopeptide (TPR) repeat protein